ncbi:MAG: hypothetical protein ACR2P0_12590 [Acidimicrobiales bacterium]
MSTRLRIGAPVLFAFMLALVACTSAVEPAVESSTTTSTLPPTTTTQTTAPPEVVTSIEFVFGSELTSTGEVTISNVRYSLAFECYAAGAGDVLALGVGEGPDGQITQAIVQAFFGQPYVALFVGENVYELAIDRAADLFVQGDAIRGGALRFVRATEGAGVGVDPGLGSVAVECDGFAPGLPDGYVTLE